MNIGRPLQFDPNVALEAAMSLFWRKGYESSSLQELIKVMGLSKSSFYQAFKSKPLLFNRCIGHYRKTMLAQMNGKLKQSLSGRTYLEQCFLGVEAETRGPDARRGCLLMNTASEFSQSNAEVAELVLNSIGAFKQHFADAIESGKAAGEIPVHKDTQQLATYLLTCMSGLRNMIKAGADSESITHTAGMMLKALD